MDVVMELPKDLENAPIPEALIAESLSVRARNVLTAMGIAKTFGAVAKLTRERLLAARNSGVKTADEIMAFRAKCLDGTIRPGRVTIPRADELLPPRALTELLSVRSQHVLKNSGILLTPRWICNLTVEKVREFEGAGKLVATELMALREKCLDGSVWSFEPVAEEPLSPEAFSSLSDYVMAVAKKACRLNAYGEMIIRDCLGLLNGSGTCTYEEVAARCDVTRSRIQQIAAKIEKSLFGEEGRIHFAEYAHCSEVIFSRRRGVLKEGEFVVGLNKAYPNWSGTTEFSALKLLEYCGVTIEKNASGCMAWMTGGDVEARYRTYLGLLEDADEPLEGLTLESVLRNADTLGLDEISEDEYRFIVQRVFDNNHRAKGAEKARWSLFLRLRCGLHTSVAERRRYAVARALRAVGVGGLTQTELVEACRKIDPNVDIGGETQQESDANPLQKYDMDGTGARLMIYDFGDRTHDKRFCLDVFFKDDELVRVIKAAGIRLRKHMEKNCLGAANITRLRKEIQSELPEKYAGGLPSACLYALMREHEAGGLKYYDHPNVAHPLILNENGRLPEKTISWLIYEYFLMSGHETATWAQLVDFCEIMLGMDGVIAAATVIPPVKGDKVVVDGEERYLLKAPDESVDPPNVLIDGGEIDSELSFCVPRGPLGMNLDAEGRARDLNTYVRAFLYELAKSGYAFTEDEKTELSDPGWCEKHLGINKAAFIRAERGSQRPNTNYWKATYRVGDAEYWVSSYWIEKYKFRFDTWAKVLAERAGFAFEAYEIPLTGEGV